MRLPRFITLAALLIAATTTHAATLIEIRTAADTARIYKHGPSARVEMAGEDNFLLINSEKSSVMMIMPAEKLVLDISESLNTPPASSKAPASGILFSAEGGGPVIAGYKTSRYGYSAGQKRCGTLFTSKDALKDADLKPVLQIVERIALRNQGLIASFSETSDPCSRFDHSLIQQLKTIGAPLRVVDAAGTVASEVLRIDRKAQLPEQAFSVPTGYTVEDAGPMIQRLTNLQRLMEQMQQSDQLAPDVTEWFTHQLNSPPRN